MSLWIYAVLERQPFFGEEWAGLVLLAVPAAVHVGTGMLAAGWWAVALPVLSVGLALPAGYPDTNRGEPFPIWFGTAVFAPFGTALIGLGVAPARRRRRARLRSS